MFRNEGQAGQIHKGRLVDHIHICVADPTSSQRFYSECLVVLGRNFSQNSEYFFIADELFVSQASHNLTTRINLAFQATSKDEVARYHFAAQQISGKDNCKPGP